MILKGSKNVTPKAQLINQIQNIANEYLGHQGLRFEPTYKYLTKAELITRLEVAQQCIEIKRKTDTIRSQYTKKQLDMLALFPQSCDPLHVQTYRRLQDLTRQTMDLWRQV